MIHSLRTTDASSSRADFPLTPSDAPSSSFRKRLFLSVLWEPLWSTESHAHAFLGTSFSSEILCSCSAIERLSYDCHSSYTRLASFFSFSANGQAEKTPAQLLSLAAFASFVFRFLYSYLNLLGKVWGVYFTSVGNMCVLVIIIKYSTVNLFAYALQFWTSIYALLFSLCESLTSIFHRKKILKRVPWSAL